MTESKVHSFFFWGPAAGGGRTARPQGQQHSSRVVVTSKDGRLFAARPHSLSHSSSSPQLGRMATVASAPPPLSPLRTNSDLLNTLPDPRSPSPSSTLSRSDSNVSHHPDLSEEVATLSTKLVKAINNQTSLDDELQAARHELKIARELVSRLEDAAKERDELIASGQLKWKDDVDKEIASLRKELDEEKERRKRLELEVNDLTASVFTEANNMVVAARLEREAADKRSEQLRNQLVDAETLLQSQQEQLQDLKGVVEKLSSEKDEDESNARTSTAPSTPAMGPHDKMIRIFDSASMTPITPGTDDIPADHPLKFTHLIHPALRHDLNAYREFAELMQTVRSSSSAPPSRVSSGSFGGLNVMGLASGLNQSSIIGSPSQTGFAQRAGNSSPRETTSSVPALKDTKVFKRALVEDLEPTLRLDIAPGLSWLARRTVLTSMTVGSFSIEPMPPPASKFRGPIYACSLCGENRKADAYSRKHRFRTTETEEAQRYPLCDYCLGRVRSSCDYISFLRMIRDGHWRAETDEEIKAAWEESVRLREKMFWQRIGGGVVPAFVQRDSPRSPTFSKANGLSRNSRELSNRSGDASQEDPFQGEDGTKPPAANDNTATEAGMNEALEAAAADNTGDNKQQSRMSMRDSLISESGKDGNATSMEHGYTDESSGSKTPMETPLEDGNRLSMTIPGSFE